MFASFYKVLVVCLLHVIGQPHRSSIEAAPQEHPLVNNNGKMAFTMAEKVTYKAPTRVDVKIEVYVGQGSKNNQDRNHQAIRNSSNHIPLPPEIILPREVLVTAPYDEDENNIKVNCSVLHADFISWTLSYFFENSTVPTNNGTSRTTSVPLKSTSIRDRIEGGEIYDYSRTVVTEPLVVNDCLRVDTLYRNGTDEEADESEDGDTVGLHLDIASSQECKEYLSNFHLRGICFARNARGTASSTFELKFSEDFFYDEEPKEGQLIGWSGFGYHRPTFKGTQAEWERFRLEGMKAGLFILGMVTPVIGGLYFTFYISCKRNSGSFGTMFGAAHGD